MVKFREPSGPRVAFNPAALTLLAMTKAVSCGDIR
jgi:hypothetical protein